MLIVPIEDARPGMKLAAPVYNPNQPQQELLRRGFVLEPPIIRRLRQLKIDTLYVEYPALDALDRHLAVQLSPARMILYRQIRASIADAQKQSRPAIAYEDYCSTTRELVSVILTQGQNPVYLEQMARQGDDAVAHATAVAHLSLLMGLKLENYLVAQRPRLLPQRAKDVVNLGVAAMLHDLGISKLPPELQNYTEADPPRADADLRQWQTHAQIGYDLIRNGVEPTAAATVYQHHQHFDGSGFPAFRTGEGPACTLAGQRIHVFARILMCANLYDRLASPPSGNKRPGRQVLRLIEKRYAAWLDPEVLGALKAVVPLYPPGSRVRLSDGTSAIVIDVWPESPHQPTVQRVAGDTWTVEGAPIDLRQPGSPKVVDDCEEVGSCGLRVASCEL